MNRDFDKEEIFNKMRALRDKRDLEIMEEEKSEKPDRKLSESKVIDVKYLGEMDEIGEVYLVIEQRKDKEGQLVQIDRYETEKGEVLGGNNRADDYDFILLSEKYKDKQELLKQLERLEKNGILDLNEMEQGRLEVVAEELGITVEELEKVVEIRADEEIVTQRDKEEDSNRLSQEELERIPTKTKMNSNQKVTDKETVASLLRVQDKGYKRIEVVESAKLQEENSTRFTFVGIREVEGENGSKKEVAEKIDTLKQRYGKTPTKEVYSVNEDGSKIEGTRMESIYQVKGDNENQVGVNIGRMGNLEVSYIRSPRQDNGKAIGMPIQTYSVRPPTRKVREFMDKQQNTDVEEEIRRIQKYQEAGYKNITLDEIDDNTNKDTYYTKDYTKIDKEYLDRLVDGILKNDQIASIYNREDVTKKLIEKMRESSGISLDELAREVEIEMEKEAQREHEQRGIQ